MSNGSRPDTWIRGVNIGGWLVLERWITPYLFALTNCHLDGDFCRYPQQVLNDANGTVLPECDLDRCLPVSTSNVDGGRYPMDEFTLTEAFPNKETARQYLELHYDSFVTQQDIRRLRKAGVTHLRVPLGYWILGDVYEGDPYIEGGWPYFRRLAEWCRGQGLEIWPDLHGAPGSQNGFDNSGKTLPSYTSKQWCRSRENLQRTLDVIEHIATQLVEDDLTNVVTGFGILNEIWWDCDMRVLREFTNDAFDILRRALGPETAIYISDSFRGDKWDGFWLNETIYKNTYLDSHNYHDFFQSTRSLSPRQHIAFVCEGNRRSLEKCCYKDYLTDREIQSKGIGRFVGEWSASFDQLPITILAEVMDGIETNGTAPYFDRQLPIGRQAFLRSFVEAQMVVYDGVSSGWFYWNFKMEGGAHAEWDFLRGVKEGWIPPVPPPGVPSEQVYGTCEEILFRTDDNYTIVNEVPDPETFSGWKGIAVDDDVVTSHGQSLLPDYVPSPPEHKFRLYQVYAMVIMAFAILGLLWRRNRTSANEAKKNGYIQL